MKKLVALVLLLGSACVTVDDNTGAIVPRGHQQYLYDDVKRRAQALEAGMSRGQVESLLGSPAEKSAKNDVWVYLPERSAVLVPARALKLRFDGGLLADHSYHPIVLGERF